MSHRFRSSVVVPALTLLVFLLWTTSAVAAININTANSESLQTLIGIGAVKAQAIIDYRNGPNGPFETKEEIMNVTGIGPATYENIKDSIIVGTTTPEPEETSNEEETSAEQQSSAGGGVFIPDTKSISVHAGADRTVVASADSVFEAQVIGAEGKPIENARVVLSFGNGDRKEGQKVLYNFAFPGTYVVTADAANDVYSASDRIVVTAIPAQITITEVTDEYIALKNGADVEVDVGGWILFSLGKQFQFPLHTILLPGQEVLVSNKRTGLSGNEPSTVALQYPNGIVATRYQHPLFVTRTSAPAQGSTQRKAAGAAIPERPEERLVSSANLITSPVIASKGLPSVWMWIFGIVVLAGGSGTLLAYVRKRRFAEYDVEEI